MSELGTEREETRYQKMDIADDFEVKLIQQESQSYCASMVPVCAMFFGMSVMPYLSHLRMCSLLTAAAIIGTICATNMIIRAAKDRNEIIDRARKVGNLNHFSRTVVHLLWLSCHHDCIFLRLVTLFLQPLSGARQSHSATSFKVYLAIHNLLTWYRFSGESLEDGLPWILGVLVATPVLIDIATQKMVGMDSRVRLDAAHKTMGSLAEATVRSLLQVFGDAVVILDADSHLVEASPSLATLLGRNAGEGKDFFDFIDSTDHELFQDHLKRLSLSGLEALEPEQKHEKYTRCSNMRAQSVRVHLMDTYGSPVAVHLLSAQLLTIRNDVVHLICVCEAWQPKQKTFKRSRITHQSAHKLNMETGKIEPSFPAYPADLDTAKLIFGNAEAQGRRQRSSRPLSPRP